MSPIVRECKNKNPYVFMMKLRNNTRKAYAEHCDGKVDGVITLA